MSEHPFEGHALDGEQGQLETLLHVLKVLADQSRLQLLGLLATGEFSVVELARRLGLRPPTVSHHLALLRELGIVSMTAEGTTHRYHLDVGGLSSLGKLLDMPSAITKIAVDVEGNAWERKILRDFFDGARLKEIPAQEKKRMVIVRWLAEQFAWGRTYTEAEVNQIIARHHPDTAALRRSLIGAHLMERMRGSYWRVGAQSGAAPAL